jgi:hypothetical protein
VDLVEDATVLVVEAAAETGVDMGGRAPAVTSQEGRAGEKVGGK